MAQTAQRTREPEQTVPAAVYVYEIRLLDGGSLWARGGDGATAETELAGLHGKLGSDPFVRVADTIVRSQDVRSVQLHEFLTLLATIAAVAIGMAASEVFDSTRGFALITVLAAAYMISRGLAKSGTRDPNPERERY